jgi:hypothetical protein
MIEQFLPQDIHKLNMNIGNDIKYKIKNEFDDSFYEYLYNLIHIRPDALILANIQVQLEEYLNIISKNPY